MHNKDGHVRCDLKFHIKDHEHYDDLLFPYNFNEQGAIIDRDSNFAIFTLDLIDSLDWEIIER